MRRRRTHPFLPEIYDVRRSTLSVVLAALAFGAIFLNRPVHASTVPHFIRSAAVKKGNRTAAFNAFELSKIGPDEKGQLKSVLFFSKRKPVCAVDAVNNEAKASPPCHSDGKYSDRTSFRFNYDFENKKTLIQEPVVSVQDGAGLRPQVQQFAVVKSDGTGSFTVLYRCTKANAIGLIRLTMRVTANDNATVSWQKTCGGGVNKYLSMTSVDLSNGDTGSIKSPLESRPMQSLSTIELKVEYPQTSLDFETPHVVSNNPGIGVKLRKTMRKGTLTVDPTKFIVLYDCHKKTLGTITLSVSVPPWESANLTWTKDCGGTHPKKILVELGSETVVNGSGVSPKFRLTEKTTVDEALSAGIHQFSASQNSLDFRISNKDSSDLQIQGAAITVSNPNILAVVSKKQWSAFGREYMTEEKTVVLKPNNFIHMKIDMVCLARGNVVVLITLPILVYKDVEFGFYKDCAEPRVFHHSGFLRTAGSLELLLAIIAIIAVVAAYKFYRRQKEASTVRYQQVRQESVSFR